MIEISTQQQRLEYVAKVMIQISFEDAADDALGVSEMFDELTDNEIEAVLDLIHSAKIEISWT